MVSWKVLSLAVAAAIAMNGVVGLEQGYGGGVWTSTPTTGAPVETTATPVQTTATPTSTESSTDQDSGSGDYTQSTGGGYDDGSSASDTDTGSKVDGSSDEGNEAYPDQTPNPDSSYGNSLSWDGSEINGGGSYPGGKFTSGDGSYVDVPSSTGDGSVDFPPNTDGNYPSSSSGSIDVPPTSDVSSSSGDVPPGKGGHYPPSSASGSDRDSSAYDDDSTAGEASTGSDNDQTPPKEGCQVRTRRLRQ